MSDIDQRPERDPAEGSREVIENDRKKKSTTLPAREDRGPEQDLPGSEAAEPSPES
ncbi:hypothetical protein HJB77_29230 [Rhizobium lentis]|uniref:hypothetical protein n=1 Tax=Rhizobium lentis TaxID=1138194 RepID=UPI001C828E98|nr:hypothetical protein [Rhizobium lentis]MBX5180286.1 hypothetical protein [Rhizobium lentis]